MKDEDLRVRGELDAAGELGDGYHPRMEAVHRRNAARLREIIADHGWPGRSLVDEDGAHAAWLILQHSIGEPDLQRGIAPVLEAAVQAGDAPAWQLAYLTDRIAVLEGRPQRYGSQLDDGDDGYLTIATLEDPAKVDEWRREVGLPPIAERLPPREKQRPTDPEQVRRNRRAMEEWARAVGWRQ